MNLAMEVAPQPLDRAARLKAPLLMGVLNCTPDSFYASSRASGEAAVQRGLKMAEEGADFLDVGGESTRPGSDPVSEDEESLRVLPVIEQLVRKTRIPVSIDTCKAGVARRALDAGATVLNDITALRGDPAMLGISLAYPKVILMHMQGIPKTMQENPHYENVVADICDFFRERINAFVHAGGDASRVLIDPGIGFGKTLEHNLEILRRLEDFQILGRPVVVGASRKSFIGRLLGGDGRLAASEERLEGSLAVACRAAMAGAAILRVHDVLATHRMLAVWAEIGRR